MRNSFKKVSIAVLSFVLFFSFSAIQAFCADAYTISINLVDYDGNSTSRIEAGGSIKSVTATQNSIGSDISTVILSLFDGGKLIKFEYVGLVSNTSNGSIATYTVNFQIPEDVSNQCSIRVLVWDDKDSMRPVNAPYQIGNTQVPSIPIVEMKDILKSQNTALYNALKYARPSLDNGNTGKITINELKTITGILNLSGRNIKSIDGLQGCISVTALYLNNNEISNIFPLNNLGQLKILQLANNKLTTIKEVGLLPNLEALNLEYNEITDATSISYLKKLKYLYLGNNKLTDIYDLRFLIGLEHLKLNDNQISSITCFITVRDLKYLDLSNNKIGSVNSLSGLNKLKDLRLTGNSVRNVDVLPQNYYNYFYVDGNGIDMNIYGSFLRGIKAINKKISQ